MKPRPTPEDRLAYALGEIDDPRTRERTERALQADPAATNEVQRIRDFKNFCESQPSIEPAPGGFDRFWARVADEAPQPPGSAGAALLAPSPPTLEEIHRRRRRMNLAVGLVVFLLLGLTLGMLSFNSGPAALPEPAWSAAASERDAADFRRAMTSGKRVRGFLQRRGSARNLSPGQAISAKGREMLVRLGPALVLLESGARARVTPAGVLALGRGAARALVAPVKKRPIMVDTGVSRVEVYRGALRISAGKGWAEVAVLRGVVVHRGGGRTMNVGAGKRSRYTASRVASMPTLEDILSLEFRSLPQADEGAGVFPARLTLRNHCGMALALRGYLEDPEAFAVIVENAELQPREYSGGAAAPAPRPVRHRLAASRPPAPLDLLNPASLYVMDMDIKGYIPPRPGSYGVRVEYLWTSPGAAPRAVVSAPIIVRVPE